MGRNAFAKSVLAVALLTIALVAVPAVAQSERSDAPAIVKPPATPGVDTPAAPPPNDTCAGATVIGAVPFTDSLSTVEATMTGEPASTCSLTGATVWYSFTYNGANSGIATADTLGSGFDTMLDVFTGGCGGLTSIACNDDASGLQSIVSFTVDPGQTYLIRAGGFDGSTGSLVFNLDVAGGACPIIDFQGVLGQGSPDWPSTSGNQLGRLTRDGVSSTCAAPKACAIFTATGDRAYDAYVFPNDSGATQCVTVNLNVLDQANCNLQTNAYLNSYDPNNICTNYLADPGLSSGIPPTPTTFSFELPADNDAVIVVHTTNPGEIGCNYEVQVVGDLCSPYVPPVIQEIPALNRYGIGALALVLGGLAFWALRRRA